MSSKLALWWEATMALQAFHEQQGPSGRTTTLVKLASLQSAYVVIGYLAPNPFSSLED
jgi:hypothetical protein